MKSLVSRAGWALAVLVVGVGTGSVVAQGQASQPDVLVALLAEVKALRGAMEQMASAGPRVQLALGRLQLQEQRIATILRRLDGIRASIASAERELDQKRAQLAGIEGATEPNEDPKELAHVVNALKTDIANSMSALQRMQSDEATALQELSAEQSRWSDINRRVEELERSLGGR